MPTHRFNIRQNGDVIASGSFVLDGKTLRSIIATTSSDENSSFRGFPDLPGEIEIDAESPETSSLESVIREKLKHSRPDSTVAVWESAS